MSAVDTTAPAAPSVSSTAYPSGSYNPASPTAGSFTFATTSTDAASFRYWFNAAARATVAATGAGPHRRLQTPTTPSIVKSPFASVVTELGPTVL